MIAINFDPIARPTWPAWRDLRQHYRCHLSYRVGLEAAGTADAGFSRPDAPVHLVGCAIGRSVRGIRSVAKSMHLKLHSVKLESLPYDFQAAFRSVAQEQAQVLLVLSSPFFAPQRSRIANFAIEHRLPAISRCKSGPGKAVAGRLERSWRHRDLACAGSSSSWRARRCVDRRAAGASYARNRRKAWRSRIRPSRGPAATHKIHGPLMG